MSEAVAKVNYTEEQTRTLVEGYKAGRTVEDLAKEVGKTVKSVTAKLVREKVYVSKAKETAGKREMLKAEMVTEISKLVGREEEVMESLEKATSTALKAVLEALRKLNEVE